MRFEVEPDVLIGLPLAIPPRRNPKNEDRRRALEHVLEVQPATFHVLREIVLFPSGIGAMPFHALREKAAARPKL